MSCRCYYTVPIACGAFGAVFKASRYGRVLAVKKYINPDDKTCERERRIYTSGMIAHSNIVSYVCSDIRYQSEFCYCGTSRY